MMDRIDLHIEVPKIEVEKLTSDADAEPSKAVRARVQAARNLQTNRFAKSGLVTNADMRTKDLKHFCTMAPEAEALLGTAARTLHLSARAYMRTIKVARTIADLALADTLTAQHVTEALQFRERVE